MVRARFLLLLVCLLANSVQASREAWLLAVEGPIGPAAADHMVRGLQAASDAGAPLLILRLDTPGGLDGAMRVMIKSILAASIPVVAYVAPGGARAASAGTYLLYASHVAAMAPGTNLGAATPVQIGAAVIPKVPAGAAPAAESTAANSTAADSTAADSTGDPMQKKIVNDAVAYIQSLAQLRGRNAQWAERAVREGASLSAEDALEMSVIEILAEDERALLQALHGRDITVAGETRALQTEGLGLHIHAADWRSRFLAVITNPNIAYVLMLLGIYGLVIEFYNPGIGLPGVVGAFCLLLALYAFQLLPISYAGLGLLLLGIVLLATEAFSPSFGVLGLGGIVAFVVGSIMLMDTQLPGYQIALPMILAFAAFSVAVLAVALGLVVRARRQAVVSGMEHIPGSAAVVETVQGGHAMVRLEGELWRARSEQLLAADDIVTVDGLEELTLIVSKVEGE